MTLFDILSVINLIVPLLVLCFIAIGYRLTGKIKVFILAPSMLYVFVYYLLYALLSHTGHTRPHDWQVLFRLGLSLVLISILAYAVVSLKDAKREYDIRRILEDK